jgi:5-methylcytosine-specific restriction endonuclease McrA
MTTKKCTKCGIEKDLSEFNIDKRNHNRARSRCKACEKEYRIQYRENNRERVRILKKKAHEVDRERHGDRIRAYAQTYYAQNQDYLRAQSRAYQASHRAENKKHCKEYYETNKENERQRVLRWMHEHPEMHRAADARRRARKQQAGGEHTAEDIKRQRECQKWRCWWCGKKCKKQYHVDHLVPLAKGGHNGPDNIVIACPTCNLSKNDKLPEEWVGKLF